MNHAALKAQLRSLINRSDMSDDLAGKFIRLAQVRLERVLRISFMHRFVTFNPPTDDGLVRLPVDYLQLIALNTDAGELRRVDTGTWLKYPAMYGTPKVFVQTGHDIRMRPYPATTDTMYLQYYGSDTILDDDLDINRWTEAAADAMLYGAALFAASHYEDERSGEFENRFNVAVAELSDQQFNEDFSGPMNIEPAYQLDNDYDY
jgi:hypothetical protein